MALLSDRYLIRKVPCNSFILFRHLYLVKVPSSKVGRPQTGQFGYDNRPALDSRLASSLVGHIITLLDAS